MEADLPTVSQPFPSCLGYRMHSSFCSITTETVIHHKYENTEQGIGVGSPFVYALLLLVNKESALACDRGE